MKETFSAMFCAIIIYLAFAFMAWNLDPGGWPVTTRVLCILAFTVCLAILNSDEDEDEEEL